MRFDLNADLGEGFGAWTMGDDDGLLEVVTSANVACGFHAGDPTIMRRVCARAAERGVAIGAQVGYRDLAGFGRRRIAVTADDLAADVLYQLGALEAFARAAGTRVRYVKPHGALYNTAAGDHEQAGAIVAAVRAYDRALPVLGLPDSALADEAADAGIPFVAEAFADRGYTADGLLVPRGRAGALFDDPATVARRAVRLARDAVADTVDGGEITVHAASVCVHGDTPGAVTIARGVRAALEDAGVELVPFAAAD